MSVWCKRVTGYREVEEWQTDTMKVVMSGEPRFPLIPKLVRRHFSQGPQPLFSDARHKPRDIEDHVVYIVLSDFLPGLVHLGRTFLDG